jgi:hypothetical protein
MPHLLRNLKKNHKTLWLDVHLVDVTSITMWTVFIRTPMFLVSTPKRSNDSDVLSTTVTSVKLQETVSSLFNVLTVPLHTIWNACSKTWKQSDSLRNSLFVESTMWTFLSFLVMKRNNPNKNSWNNNNYINLPMDLSKSKDWRRKEMSKKSYQRRCLMWYQPMTQFE